MSSGRHSSDEEFDFEFDFENIKGIAIIIVILAIIIAVIFGAYKLVNKMKKTEEVSNNESEIVEEKYDVLGKIVIRKIEVEQEILDSKENKALEQGVIKLYGDDLNEERKFLYCRSQLF